MTVYVGATNVPVSVTDCEIAGAMTFMCNTAFFVLGVALVGLKVTLTVQLLLTANVAPQVLV